MRVEKRNSSLTVSKITEARHGLLTGEAVSSSTMAERGWGGGKGEGKKEQFDATECSARP